MAAAAAAVSTALRCCGGKAFLSSENGMPGGNRAMEGRCRPLHLRRSCSSVATRRWTVRAAVAVGNTAASTSSVCVDPFGPWRIPTGHKEKSDTGREPVSPEKLDEWMQESVAEIVRSIGEAPFLVHVFSNKAEGRLRLEREPADEVSWPHIRRRWSTGAALPPDGVILVEELKDGGGEEDGREGEAIRLDDDDGDASSSSSSSGSSHRPAAVAAASSSKTWGVLVQGRGTDGAACYILNTCRVRSSFGFCTHFCLAKAKCFGDTADVQLRKAWLLGSRHQKQQ